MNSTFFILGGLSAIMLLGCAGLNAPPPSVRPPPEAATPAPTADTTWKYSPMQVETLHTVRVETPLLWEIKPLHYDPYIFKQSVTSPSEEKRSSETRASVNSGYRVQLFAGKEYHAAQKIKAEAEAQLNVPIYVIFVAPQYKVRAGDFIQRTDAENLCAIAQAQGFKDAWVVGSQVEASH